MLEVTHLQCSVLVADMCQKEAMDSTQTPVSVQACARLRPHLDDEQW